ncbi:hypothetical protein GCM10011504_47990 [Siccirubricoccus deserti]|nr:hypothetical protein GCM10011504_47990 [Siccirubricoccus deserti]
MLPFQVAAQFASVFALLPVQTAAVARVNASSPGGTPFGVRVSRTVGLALVRPDEGVGAETIDDPAPPTGPIIA